jgi:hypothetical protein
MPATPALVEHEAETLVMRRVVGIALVGEGLVDRTNSTTFDAPSRRDTIRDIRPRRPQPVH